MESSCARHDRLLGCLGPARAVRIPHVANQAQREPSWCPIPRRESGQLKPVGPFGGDTPPGRYRGRKSGITDHLHMLGSVVHSGLAVRISEKTHGFPENFGEAVPAFQVSCVKLAELKDDQPVGADGHGGTAKQWRRACDKASKLKAGDNKAAREFFESEFTPFEAAGKSGPVGKLTGYFVQEINASRKKGGKYTVPILAPGLRGAGARRTPRRGVRGSG